MAKEQARKILVVDDEENIRRMLEVVLRREGYQVDLAASATEALEVLQAREHCLMLSDVRMPGMDGLALLKEVQIRHPRLQVVVMSAYGSVDTAIEAIQQGAQDYISKPFKPAEIALLLRKVEERDLLKRENLQLKSDLERLTPTGGLCQMVGHSPSMQKLFQTVRKVADYDTTVLIQGESGTGKELVASALHELSSRAKAPFVAVNCGAIPDNLLESELFGHKRGAFTDATSDKKGLFTEADGGTLFLDELADLPLNVQVKLLRVLQEQEVRPVGETRGFKVDVRVVAATVRDLQQAVEDGKFREDLFYRLSVLPLKLPTLRQRKEDIPDLVQHLLLRHNERLKTSVRAFSPNAMKVLLDYSWPGNVRELQNTVEHAMVLSEGTVVEPEELPPRLHDTVDLIQDTESAGLSIKKATRMIEERLIKLALKKTRGNRTTAAKLLEISHRALLYKIKDFAITD